MTTEQMNQINIQAEQRMQALCDELWAIFLRRLPTFAFEDEIEALDLKVLEETYHIQLTNKCLEQLKYNYEHSHMSLTDYQWTVDYLIEYYRRAESGFLETTRNLNRTLQHIAPDMKLLEFQQTLGQFNKHFLDLMGIYMVPENQGRSLSPAFVEELQHIRSDFTSRYEELSPRSQALCKPEYLEALAEIRILLGHDDVILLPQTERKLQLIMEAVGHLSDSPE